MFSIANGNIQWALWAWCLPGARLSDMWILTTQILDVPVSGEDTNGDRWLSLWKKIKGPVMCICFIAILPVGCWIGCYIDQPTNGNRTSMNGSMNGSECVAGLQSSKIHKTEFQACFEKAIFFRSWGQWPSADNSWNRLQVSCQW